MMLKRVFLSQVSKGLIEKTIYILYTSLLEAELSSETLDVSVCLPPL